MTSPCVSGAESAASHRTDRRNRAHSIVRNGPVRHAEFLLMDRDGESKRGGHGFVDARNPRLRRSGCVSVFVYEAVAAGGPLDSSHRSRPVRRGRRSRWGWVAVGQASGAARSKIAVLRFWWHCWSWSPPPRRLVGRDSPSAGNHLLDGRHLLRRQRDSLAARVCPGWSLIVASLPLHPERQKWESGCAADSVRFVEGGHRIVETCRGARHD